VDERKPLADVDPKKCGTTYANHRCKPPCVVPVVHFTELSGMAATVGGGERDVTATGGAREVLPVVVCVAKRRKGRGVIEK